MLKDKQIEEWRRNGYFIGRNILDKKLVEECKILLEKRYYKPEVCCKDFGSDGEFEFPSNTVLDKITLHPNIIRCVKQLLRTDNVLLTQSDAWSKTGKDNIGKYNNNNQRMHMDYGNHTFLHINEWNEPETVAMIIYLSDIKQTEGGTGFVPYLGNEHLYKVPYINMPGQNNYKFINNKELAEEYFNKKNINIYEFRQELYEKEQIVKCGIGDILFYRLDLWHRGTPVKKGEIRNVINLCWKKGECTWINIWNKGWTRRMYYEWLEKYFIELTPEQRSVLGVPEIGNKYWNERRLLLLKSRYPKIDIEPYLSKL